MGLLPDPSNAPEIFPHADKLIHFGVYGLWGALLFINRKLPPWVLIIACVLAFIQEATQLGVEERSFEWLDWLADSVGIVCGWWAVRMVWKYTKWDQAEE